MPDPQFNDGRDRHDALTSGVTWLHGFSWAFKRLSSFSISPRVIERDQRFKSRISDETLPTPENPGAVHRCVRAPTIAPF